LLKSWIFIVLKNLLYLRNKWLKINFNVIAGLPIFVYVSKQNESHWLTF
jgi:hypothetical protein